VRSQWCSMRVLHYQYRTAFSLGRKLIKPKIEASLGWTPRNGRASAKGHAERDHKIRKVCHAIRVSTAIAWVGGLGF